MLGGVHLSVRTVFRFGIIPDHANQSLSISHSNSISNSLTCSFSSFSHQLRFKSRKFHRAKSILIFCKTSPGDFGEASNNGDERDDEYLEALVMISETVRHHRLRMQGFLEETKWNSGQLFPFSIQAKESKPEVRSIGLGFLRRFQSPTIFLKIACDGDLLLPIIVGEFAIEKLIDALRGDENGGCPNQFQFVKNLVGKLGYEVKMVRITERVVNTYYARIYCSKPGEKAILSVDARPSDAINVAMRCKVPIYVNKQIVLTDAIKIVHGTRRGSDVKSIYDVSLDRWDAIVSSSSLSLYLQLCNAFLSHNFLSCIMSICSPCKLPFISIKGKRVRLA